jgi:hypothetical protein
MLNQNQPNQPLQKSLDELVEAVANSQTGSMVTGWCMVVEFIGEDGEYYLLTLHDDKKPVWQHKALLNEGLDDLASEIEEEVTDDDDY